MSDFEDIFNGVKSTLEKDPHARILKAGDVQLSSRAPFGVLTGIPELDLNFGRPGLPAGKVVEYFGFEMSGKTTAAFHVLAQAQRKGGAGLYIDAEQSWDESKAKICGIDPDNNFGIVDVNTVEGIFRALESCVEGLIKTKWNKPFIAIVDSVTAVQTQRGLETEIGAEPRVGEEARVIRHAMRKLTHQFAKANMIPIFINHAIANIGASPFSKQSDSSGGHAIKLMSSVRLQFGSGSNTLRQEKGEKIRTGMKSYIKIVKLKGSALQHPQVECALTNDRGFDTRGSLLEAMIRSGLCTEKSGKLYTFNAKDNPVEFKKAEWPEIVDGLGGVNSLYDFWVEWSLLNGCMKPWSEH